MIETGNMRAGGNEMNRKARMKKCIVFFLSIAMVLAMSVPAFAAEGGATANTETTPAAAQDNTIADIQSKIDKLPDAGDITSDNVGDVKAQLETIDKAKVGLTDEEISKLKTDKYTAAVEKISKLEQGENADVPKGVAGTNTAATVTNIEKGTVKYYNSVGDALKQLNLVTNKNSEVKLYEDYTSEKQVSVRGAGNKIDLNGHTYTYTGNGTGSCAFALNSKASLEIAGGVVNATNEKAKPAIMATGKSSADVNITIAKDATIKGSCIFLQGKTVTLNVYGTIDNTGTKEAAIIGNGSDGQGPTTVNIYDGAVVKADGIAVYHPQAGTFNIEGGEISGSTGIYMKAGTLNVFGGNITGNGEKHEYIYNDNGANPTGDAIVLDACGYPGGVPVVNTFKGATVISEKANAIECYHYAGENSSNPNADMADKNFITGGVFSNDVTKYCADNLKTVQTENSGENYVIQAVKFAEMQIGDAEAVTYDDQTKFINDLQKATGNIKIKLLGDIEIKGYVPVLEAQNVTFDLNGSTLSTALQQEGRHYYAIDNYGTLTIMDSSADGSGTIRARGIENLGNGKLTVDSGTIVSIDKNGGACIWNEADLVVNGGTFKTEHVGSSGDSAGVGCLNNSGKALITCGTFEDVNKRTYAVISTGNIEITPAEGKEVIIHGAHGGLGVDSGTAVVNGGSYNSDEYYGMYVSNDGKGKDPEQAAVTVNGGTFNGNTYSVWVGSDVNDPVNSTIAITNGTFKKPLNAQDNTRDDAIEISGGAFSEIVPDKYCAEGYAPVRTPNEDGNYTVKMVVAQIGDKEYTTIEEALKAAKDGDTVELLKNVEIKNGETVTIASGATLKINDNATLTNQGTIEIYGDITGKVSGTGTVNYHIKAIAINAHNNSMKVGEEQSLTVTKTPENAVENVAWSIDNDKVATIDENGKLIAIGEGTVTVTAKAADGITADCTITVSKSATTVQEAPAKADIKDSTYTTITLAKIDTNKNGAAAKYSSDGGKTWQGSNVFENLLPGTEYTFVVRYDATKDGNYAESPVSEALKASTKTGATAATVTPDDRKALSDEKSELEKALENGAYSDADKAKLKQRISEIDAALSKLDSGSDSGADFSDDTNPADNSCNADLAESEDNLIDALLTDEEKNELENGKDVKVWLKVTDISATVSEPDKDLVDTKRGNATVGMYLDIDLLKQIGSDPSQNITETNDPVTITLKVPDTLVNTDASVTRTYQMIRVHDGKVTVIPCNYDAAKQTISFETDQFSTYALAYVDRQNSSGGGNTTDTAKPGDTAKPAETDPNAAAATDTQTGDNSNLLLWFTLLFLSGFGVTATIMASRKKKASR